MEGFGGGEVVEGLTHQVSVCCTTQYMSRACGNRHSPA